MHIFVGRARAHTGFLLVSSALFMGNLQAQNPDDAYAQQLLLPFKQELQNALLAGLAESPAAAIDACALLAPDIAESLSIEGIRLGRTSQKLRNSTNTSPEWVTPFLEAYMSDPDHRAPQSTSISEGVTGYVEAIEVLPICMTCHGTELSPEVSSRLDAQYPQDQAIGYQVGDLRGVFWLEYPSL